MYNVSLSPPHYHPNYSPFTLLTHLVSYPFCMPCLNLRYHFFCILNFFLQIAQINNTHTVFIIFSVVLNFIWLFPSKSYFWFSKLLPTVLNFVFRRVIMWDRAARMEAFGIKETEITVSLPLHLLECKQVAPGVFEFTTTDDVCEQYGLSHRATFTIPLTAEVCV